MGESSAMGHCTTRWKFNWRVHTAEWAIGINAALIWGVICNPPWNVVRNRIMANKFLDLTGGLWIAQDVVSITSAWNYLTSVLWRYAVIAGSITCIFTKGNGRTANSAWRGWKINLFASNVKKLASPTQQRQRGIREQSVIAVHIKNSRGSVYGSRRNGGKVKAPGAETLSLWKINKACLIVRH